jgi:hypothetical protein
LCYSQSDDDPHKDLVEFWLQVKYESKIVKTSFHILCHLLEPCMKNLGFLQIFGLILAIEILVKHMILALLILNLSFWLYIAQEKNMADAKRMCEIGIDN